MVETPDKIPLPGLASNGRVSRRRQDHLGLLKRRQLMNVAQELQEAHLPRQVGFAEPPQYPHIGLQQRKEALRSILMHVPARVFLLRVLHCVMRIARDQRVAAGRVRGEFACQLAWRGRPPSAPSCP